MAGNTRHRETHRARVHSDFSTGLWTPTIGDDSLDGTGEGQAYTNQNGHWQRWADWVNVQGFMVISDLGTMTAGQGARLLDFPFPMLNEADSEPCFEIVGTSLAVPVLGQNITAVGVINTQLADLMLWDGVAGVTALLVSELSVGAGIRITGAYLAEPQSVSP